MKPKDEQIGTEINRVFWTLLWTTTFLWMSVIEQTTKAQTWLATDSVRLFLYRSQMLGMLFAAETVVDHSQESTTV